MDEINQRRGDYELRAVINGLHSIMMASNHLSDLNRYTLQSLAKLSKADSLYIVERAILSPPAGWRFSDGLHCSDSDSDEMKLSSLQKERIAEEIARRFQKESRKFKQHFGLVTFTELNNPLFSPFSTATRYMILPLKDDRNVYAVAVLLSNSDFSVPLFNRLKPFSLAYSCAYRSLNASQVLLEQKLGSTVSHGRYERLFNSSFHSVITADNDLNITSVNSAAEATFGYSVSDMIGRSVHSIFSDTMPVVNDNKESNESGELPPYELLATARHKEGKEIAVRLKYMMEGEGNEKNYTLIASDISGHLAALDDYEESLSAYKTLNDLCPIGILELDQSLKATRFNDYWVTLSGLAEDETEGYGWISAISREDAQNCLEDMRESLTKEESYQGHFRLQSPLGQVHWVEAKAQPLYTAKHRVRGYLCTLINITEHRNVERQLRELAELDHLTGLYNRSIFKERLQHALAMNQRHNDPLVLMLLDLDGFKQINDTFGHSAGDNLLKQVAHRLQNIFRADDVVARLGGDEFTILLTRTDLDHACFIADKVIAEIKKPYLVEDQYMVVTCSLGVVTVLPDERASVDELMQRADIALYAAKDCGRDEFQFFTDILNQELRQKQRLITALHDALAKNEFSVVFQPQLDTASNRVTGFETLLRWHNQGAESIDTHVFIPLLESSSVVDEVSLWVLEQTCILAKDIEKEFGKLELDGEVLTFGINIAARQLRDSNFVSNVERVLSKARVSPEHITFELTEHSIIHQVDRIYQVLNSLSEMGIVLSLDDFGTGYSSLSLLQRLPVQNLKIDKSFVQKMFAQEKNFGIVKGMINLAHDLNMTVVAEGVDDAQALKVLKECRCDNYQGYLFSKPVKKESVIPLLIKNSQTNQRRLQLQN